MTTELVPLGTLVVTIGTTTRAGDVPTGRRVVVEFTDVVIEGERLRAKKKAGAPAGDWLIVGSGDVAMLDIRFTLETDDGATIHVEGRGRTDAAQFATGGATYFAPTFETADARYAWLNKVQGIARGLTAGNVVTFELFEVR